MRIPKLLRLAGEAARVGRKMVEKLAAYLCHAPLCSVVPRRLAARSLTFTYHSLWSQWAGACTLLKPGEALNGDGHGVGWKEKEKKKKKKEKERRRWSHGLRGFGQLGTKLSQFLMGHHIFIYLFIFEKVTNSKFAHQKLPRASQLRSCLRRKMRC